MVTTIRNIVGSNLYRPFALGQRLLLRLRRLQDVSDSPNTNVVSDDAHLQSRFNGRGTPSFAPTRRLHHRKFVEAEPLLLKALRVSRTTLGVELKAIRLFKHT